MIRKYMDILNEALAEDMIDANATPPEYEADDAQHYEARRKTGFFGDQASGAILMAKTTGRILIVLRSAQVDQPHTWGNCGGAIHQDKKTGVRLTPVENARKEVHEETGYTGSVNMIPLYVFSKDTFKYYNFLGIVEDEFQPHLGWEADRAVWVEVGQWPKPLHFGVKALFGDAASMKTIKHYADMFKNGKHAVEGVQEALTLPAGVDVSKAIGAANTPANAALAQQQQAANGTNVDADDDGTDPAQTQQGTTTVAPPTPGTPAANGAAPAPQQGQNAPTATGAPATPPPAPAAPAPAPARQSMASPPPAPKKSLAPITPQ